MYLTRPLAAHQRYVSSPSTMLRIIGIAAAGIALGIAVAQVASGGSIWNTTVSLHTASMSVMPAESVQAGVVPPEHTVYFPEQFPSPTGDPVPLPAQF